MYVWDREKDKEQGSKRWSVGRKGERQHTNGTDVNNRWVEGGKIVFNKILAHLCLLKIFQNKNLGEKKKKNSQNWIVQQPSFLPPSFTPFLPSASLSGPSLKWPAQRYPRILRLGWLPLVLKICLLLHLAHLVVMISWWFMRFLKKKNLFCLFWWPQCLSHFWMASNLLHKKRNSQEKLLASGQPANLS